jgi:hypothetical protein
MSEVPLYLIVSDTVQEKWGAIFLSYAMHLEAMRDDWSSL